MKKMLTILTISLLFATFSMAFGDDIENESITCEKNVCRSAVNARKKQCTSSNYVSYKLCVMSNLVTVRPRK